MKWGKINSSSGRLWIDLTKTAIAENDLRFLECEKLQRALRLLQERKNH